MSKPETLLENWCRHGDKLYGQFYHHAVIADGEFKHTSRILSIDDGIAETENTVYTLGRQQQNKCGRTWCGQRE